MTSTPRYPSVTDASLVPFRAIEAQLKQFPDLLDRSDCPYPPHVRTMLRKLSGESAGPSPEDRAMDDEDLVAETSSLYREIRTASQSQTMKSGDPKDTAQVFKTMADLLGKVIALREKAVNIREMSRFQKATLELLEQVLTPAQRSDFVEKLGKYINVS